MRACLAGVWGAETPSEPQRRLSGFAGWSTGKPDAAGGGVNQARYRTLVRYRDHKILIARATTSATVASETAAWTAIAILVQRVSGIVSVAGSTQWRS